MKKHDIREWVELENHGQKIFGMFHRPLHAKKSPAVLMCHGFGGTKISKFRVYVLLSERLAEAGIASFRFDFRGSGDSEGDFSEMTLAGEVSDALKAMSFLENHPAVDPERIGILGRSLGGVVAVQAAKKLGNIKSLALWSPAFNGKQWLEKWATVQNPAMDSRLKKQLMRFNGQLANETFLKEFFGVRLEEELKELHQTPFFHIHGEKDFEVNIEHAELYMNCRKGAEGKTYMIRLPNTDHDFSDPEERELAIEETTQWFKKTL